MKVNESLVLGNPTRFHQCLLVSESEEFGREEILASRELEGLGVEELSQKSSESVR